MNEINDETLRRALKSLPRVESGAGFARRVMNRLPERPAAPRSLPRLYLGLAAITLATAVIVALTIPGLLRTHTPMPRSAEVAAGLQAGDQPRPAQLSTRAGAGKLAQRVATSEDPRLHRLLAEREAILLELQRFRRETEAPRPMLYLGGDESVDLVVDLAAVAHRRPASSTHPSVRRSDARNKTF